MSDGWYWLKDESGWGVVFVNGDRMYVCGEEGSVPAPEGLLRLKEQRPPQPAAPTPPESDSPDLPTWPVLAFEWEMARAHEIDG
jgi:hypothetical protein